MSKQVYFTDKDKELIWQIEAFREAQGLSSFVEAVRRLCKYGLGMNSIVKNPK